MENEFQPWTGEYEKQVYEVKLKSGEVVACWPNADTLHALDNSGRVFVPVQIDGLRPSEAYLSMLASEEAEDKAWAHL